MYILMSFKEGLLLLTCAAALIYTAHFRFCFEGRLDRPDESERQLWLRFMMWLLALFISVMLGPVFGFVLILLIAILIA